MLSTSRLDAPERVSRGMALALVILLGAAVAVPLSLTGAIESAGTHSTAAELIGNAVSSVAHGAAALVDVAAEAWQDTLRELAKLVRKVLDWKWWPFEISVTRMDLRGGANVLHP